MDHTDRLGKYVLEIIRNMNSFMEVSFPKLPYVMVLPAGLLSGTITLSGIWGHAYFGKYVFLEI